MLFHDLNIFIFITPHILFISNFIFISISNSFLFFIPISFRTYIMRTLSVLNWLLIILSVDILDVSIMSDKKECDLFKKPNSSWKFRCVQSDLFSAPTDYSLAHCVGSDLRMGAGIAVKFRFKFGRVEELRRQNAQTGEIAVLKSGRRFIYYLVTKQSSIQKPKLAAYKNR